MKIFIMRHGEAEHFAASDAERALTERGIRESIAIAQSCHQKGVTGFDKVLVSPYLRAQQTWQQIQPIFPESTFDICHDITPYGQADLVFDYVSALVDVEQLQSLLLVSHLPLVGYLTSEFLTDLPPPIFPTSGMIGIEFDPVTRRSELLWQLYP